MWVEKLKNDKLMSAVEIFAVSKSKFRGRAVCGNSLKIGEKERASVYRSVKGNSKRMV
jgi:hypothetical protein